MNDQIFRHLQILRLIPRAPRWIKIIQLHDKLRDQGIDVTKRTLQRDMNVLIQVFPFIFCNKFEESQDNCFYWAENAPMVNFSGLSINQALSLSLLQKYLTPLFPAVTLEELEPFFDQADATLDGITDNPLQRWPEKIAVVPPTQPLSPPKIHHRIQKNVSSALLNNTQLDLIYQRSNGDKDNYRVNPLGLVLRGAVSYLIATKEDNQELRIFALHRIFYAIQTDETAIRPSDFNLQNFINQGQMEFNFTGVSFQPIKLVALFDDISIKHLYETRLSEDQVIENLGNNQNKITSTDQETEQLFWWLLSFGARVEVLEPLELRNKMTESVRALAKKYAI